MVSSKATTPAAYLASLSPARRKVIAACKAAGKKLDMGGGCIRFKSLEDLPLGVIGDIVAATPVTERIQAAEAARKTKKGAAPLAATAPA